MMGIDEIGIGEMDKKVLPKGWRWKKLADICVAIRGVTFPSSASEYVDFVGSIACLTTSAVQQSVDWDTRRFIPRELVSSKQILAPGDLIVSTANSKELVGKSALVSVIPFECTFGAFVTVLRPNEQTIPDFLYFLMNASFAKEFCFVKSSHTTGISNLKVETLLNMDVPLPPLPEQKRIAAILSERLAAVEQARKASQARLEAARALPAAYLREVFESEEAKGWPIHKVGDISQVSGGIQKTPARAPVNHFRPYLTVRNVQRGYFDLTQVEQFEITEAELKRYRLQHKDILIVEGNGSPSHIGRNALFMTDGQEWIHQNHIIRVRIDQRTCLPEFASAYLNSEGGKSQMLEKAETTSGLYTLSTSKIKALELPVPSLSVQKRSIQVLYKHRKAVMQMGDFIAEEKAAIDTLPASLLHQAFSGSL